MFNSDSDNCFEYTFPSALSISTDASMARDPPELELSTIDIPTGILPDAEIPNDERDLKQ